MPLNSRLALLAVLALALLPALIGGPAEAHGAAKEVVETAAPEPDSLPDAAVWGCPMCETIRQAEPGTCPICRMDLVLIGPEAEAAAAADPDRAGSLEPAHAAKKPLMPGLPNSIFYGSIVGILALSFLLFDFLGRRQRARPDARARRWDLFRLPGLRRVVGQRHFRFWVQLPVFLIFAIVLYAGLFGNQNAARNLAPVVTWTIWWTWLVIAILFLGKAWCTVCPWMAVAEWVERLVNLFAKPNGARRGRRWPRALRNIWLATGMFVGLTWLELGFGVTDRPRLTAMLGLCMVAVSILTVLVFERKAFCRYACLVGRVSGLYANFSATELRARDKDLCRSCGPKGCYKGDSQGDPCPTHQFMGSMDRNTYCTMCMECVRTCHKNNIAWNVRPPGTDLLEQKRTRVDEAYLAVMLLSMSAFHGLSMTPKWDQFVGWISETGSLGQLASFSLGMASMLAVPLILYFGICLLMKLVAGDHENSVHTLFIRFSYSLLPIALFYHLAHNLQHIFYEGLKLVRIASDPFGWGWDLFGTAHMPISAVLPASVGWWIQIGLILVGHIYGLLIAHRAAYALYDQPRQATLSQLPMLVAMAIFSLQSLWLLSQPMLMRTAM